MNLKCSFVEQIPHKAIGLNVLYLFKNMHLLSQNTEKMINYSQFTLTTMRQVHHSLKNRSYFFHLFFFFFFNHISHMERETHDQERYFFRAFPLVHVSHSTTISCLPEKLFLKHSTYSTGYVCH